MTITPAAEKINRVASAIFSLLTAVSLSLLVWAVGDWLWLAVALPFSIILYLFLTRKYRRRHKLWQQPFPAEWPAILNRYVAFYRALSPEECERFHQKIKVFLDEVPVIGVDTEVDDTILVLVAASAIIPIFGFPEWEYENMCEVLIREHAFDAGPMENDGIVTEGESTALGMVGSGGVFSGVMVLSKWDLLNGFDVAHDSRNVGIHEFAHLVDKANGDIDGVPCGLPREGLMPWINLIRSEMQKMAAGKSRDIDRYGLTNEQEFFAVIAEYFFEQPDQLEEKHPELYEILKKVFRQDTRSRFATALRSMIHTRPKRQLGRNDPCPCGSGRKYKKCCLRKRRGRRRRG